MIKIVKNILPKLDSFGIIWWPIVSTIFRKGHPGSFMEKRNAPSTEPLHVAIL